LQQAGFNVQEITVSPAKGYRGASHTLRLVAGKG